MTTRNNPGRLTWTTRLHKGDGFSPLAEFLDDYHHSENGAQYGMDPTDGLPRPAVPVTFEDTKAPALTPENLVCLGTSTRPVCAHYKRQMVDVAGTDHKLVLRFCVARTDEDGGYMSLRDSAIYACDLRSPPDPVSGNKLDEADAKIMADAAEAAAAEAPFDLETALRGETK